MPSTTGVDCYLKHGDETEWRSKAWTGGTDCSSNATNCRAILSRFGQSTSGSIVSGSFSNASSGVDIPHNTSIARLDSDLRRDADGQGGHRGGPGHENDRDREHEVPGRGRHPSGSVAPVPTPTPQQNIHSATPVPATASVPSLSAATTLKSTLLNRGDALAPDAFLTSATSGNARLHNQLDGNFVLIGIRAHNKPLWSTRTLDRSCAPSHCQHVLELSAEGVLRAVAANGTVVWTPPGVAASASATELVVTDDCNLVLRNEQRVLWASGTTCDAAPVQALQIDHEKARKGTWRNCAAAGANKTQALFVQLKLVSEILEQNAIPHMIVHGTLLGAIRSHTMNPQEFDNDIAIVGAKLEAPDVLRAVREALEKRGLILFMQDIWRVCTLASSPRQFNAEPWNHNYVPYLPMATLRV